MKALRAEVENAALHAGIPTEEKPYSPHVTLGRRNSTERLPESVRKAMEEDAVYLSPWTVDEIILMRSELSRYGPSYTPLRLVKI